MGRPSDFTPEIAEEICDRVAKGESLRTICGADRDDFTPSERTIYRWLESGEPWAAEFRQQYAHAREAQADVKFDEAWAIAKAATPENVQVARLQVDTIKWQASKLVPKKYGDRVDVSHSGEVAHRHDLSGYSADELDALEKLVAKGSDASRDQG